MDQNKSSEDAMASKVDIDEYDRKLREIIFELNRKRILLDECQQQMNESLLKQQDLERQLIHEKHKNSNDEYHSIILRNAAEALEEDRQKSTKELVKLKVHLKLAVAERDSLRAQVRSQCLEIYNLKREVDDLSSKHRCHSAFQKDISEQLHKIKSSLNQVNDLMNPLRKKQEELDKHFQTNHVSEQLLLLSAKQFENQKNIATNERKELERKLIIKSAELHKLQELLEDYPFISKPFDSANADYWKETCQDLESQLRLEKDGTEILTNTLKVSHENEEYLRKQLLKCEEKVSGLEENLQKFNLDKNDAETQTETNEKILEIVDLVKSEEF